MVGKWSWTMYELQVAEDIVGPEGASQFDTPADVDAFFATRTKDAGEEWIWPCEESGRVTGPCILRAHAADAQMALRREVAERNEAKEQAR